MTFSVTHLEGGAAQRARAMSPAVVTQGGRTVWLSGQTATSDLEGKDIAWEFDAQVRACFGLMDLTLKRLGGNLSALVHTTTYLLDARHGERLVELRKEFFPAGKYPGTTMLTVAGFARPGILVEIQGIAVLP